MYEIDTKTGGTIWLLTIEAFKVNSDNSNSEAKASKGGIYRGIKHDAIQNNKSAKNPGIYRGTKTAA